MFAFVTVAPVQDLKAKTGSSYKRWLIDDVPIAEAKNRTGVDDNNDKLYELLGRGDVLGPLPGVSQGVKLLWSNAPPKFSQLKTTKCSIDNFFGQFAEATLFRGTVMAGKPRTVTGVPYKCIFGEPANAAIYRITDEDAPPA